MFLHNEPNTATYWESATYRIIHRDASKLRTRNQKSVIVDMSCFSFWATVYQTIRPMLSDRCLSVCLSVYLSCLSVTLVYCG